MKSLLICPDERKALAPFSEMAPVAIIPILGKSLLEYWIEYLAGLGARDISIVAGDRVDSVRALTGNGARWGLRVTVFSEQEEFAKRSNLDGSSWLPAPNDVIQVDHLPRVPSVPLNVSFAHWFAAVRAQIPYALTPDRIGVHEVKPGVWIGLHTRVAPSAQFIAPCWIGEYSWVGAGAIIGPNVALENKVFVSRGAEISESYVGPDTFVGQFTEIHNSIAWGNTLINWERDSSVKVRDEFLLCSLEPQQAVAEPKSSPNPSKLRFREYASGILDSLSAKIIPPC